MVRLAQTVHLSCTKTNTISKRTERRFYMTHVSLEFHRVRPKWFMRLWYVWCKPWIYLAPRLTLYPNGPKRVSTWSTSPRSSIGCTQNDFRAYGMFGTNRAPILDQDLHCLQTNWNELSIWASSPRSTIWCVQNNFWVYGTIGANRAPILHWN
jgi:hypothetical protein